MRYRASRAMNKQRDKGQGTRPRRAEQHGSSTEAGQDRTGQGGETAKAWTAWTRAQKSPAGVNLRGDVYNLNDTIRYSITTAHAAIREARMKASFMQEVIPLVGAQSRLRQSCPCP